jgi:hypothetical protein
MPSKTKRLKLKSRIILSRDVSLAPHAQLKMGETGRIVALEQDEVGVWQAEVRFDKTHPGLSAWKNEALLTQPELDALMLKPSEAYRVVALSAAFIIASVVTAGTLLHSYNVAYFVHTAFF